METLVVADAPSYWRRGYLTTFGEGGAARPTPLDLVEMEVDGREAIVTVRLNGHAQVRGYRLTEAGWRRAPLTAALWGAPDERVLPGITLRFLARDGAFADSLAGDLPTLQATVNQWGSAATIRAIELDAREFVPPLIRDYPMVIRLNSPLLVSPDGLLSGEGKVRMALASALIAHTAPAVPADSTLPGAPRLLQALRAAVAMHWALAPAEQEAVRTLWRQAAREGWRSPIGAGLDGSEKLDVLAPGRDEAAALLMGEYLARTHDSSAVAALAGGLASARSWDALFLASVGRYAQEIEREAMAYAQEGLEGAAHVRERFQLAVTRAPFDGVVQGGGGAGQMTMQRQGTGAPIAVQVADVPFVGQDGAPLPIACAPLYAAVRVEGSWLEAEQRLQATHLQAQGVAPARFPRPSPAPPEPLAFLARWGAEGKPEALSALGADGRITEIADLRGLTHLWPIEGEAAGAAALVEWRVPRCSQSWFFLLDLASGGTRQWLTPPLFGSGHVRAFWRSAGQEVLLTVLPIDQLDEPYRYRWRVGLLGAPDGQSVPLVGSFSSTAFPLGWDGASERLLTFRGDQRGKTVGFWAGGSAEPERTLDLDTHEPIVSPLRLVGGRLAYMEAATLGEEAGALVRLFDPGRGESVVLAWVAKEDAVYVGGQLLTYTGPAGTRPVTLKRLLLLDPATPQHVTVVAEVAGAEQIGAVQPCTDGSLLYTVEGEAGVTLHRWHLAGGDSALAELPGGLELWGCP